MQKYYALFLSKEETKDPRCKGIIYANMHKDRWVDVTEFKDDFMCGYDKGVAVFSYNDKVYNIFKEYALVNDGDRLYIACDLSLDSDNKEYITTVFDKVYRNKKEEILNKILKITQNRYVDNTGRWEWMTIEELKSILEKWEEK